MIRIVNGVKEFDVADKKIRALNRVNIHIKKGEMVGIIGHSGSGKSTLLNIIAGFDNLTKGQYFFNGKIVREQNNDIGMIFQDYKLFDFLNVEENIKMGIYYLNRKADETYYKEITKELKLNDLLRKNVKTLSGGEKQRVAIARALLANKPIILADEPSGALDQDNSDLLMKILLDLNNKGKTIIIVTHDLKIAQQCKRIIRMDKGYAC